MADIGQIINATKMQLIITIVLGLLGAGISYMVYSSAESFEVVMMNPLYLAASGLSLVGWLIAIWAGYAAAKATGGGAVEGGLAGAIILMISGLITGVINLMLIIPIMQKFGGEMVALVAGGAGIIGLVIGLVIVAIIGFILGAIGGFIGKPKQAAVAKPQPQA